MAAQIDKVERARLRGRLADMASDRSLEWFSALLMVWWCGVLALPGDTLRSQPVFMPFLRWGLSSTHWVIIFGSVGMARLVALYINGRWPQGPVVRMVGAIIGAIVWAPTFILLTQGFSQYHSLAPGPGAYALLAVADLLAIRRAAHDARYYRS